jgi:hypothetical protein
MAASIRIARSAGVLAGCERVRMKQLVAFVCTDTAERFRGSHNRARDCMLTSLAVALRDSPKRVFLLAGGLATNGWKLPNARLVQHRRNNVFDG